MGGLYNTPCRFVKQFLYPLIVVISALFLILSQGCGAYARTIDSGTKVGFTITVSGPAGKPEVYNTSKGLAQWQSGLPIPVNDTLSITAAIASGTETIKGISFCLDGKPLKPLAAAPWTVSISGGTLALGDHLLVINTALDDKHNAVATFPLTFTVVESMPAALTPRVPAVTSVKGAQQLLQQGSVASVDLLTTPGLPPVVGGTGQQTTDPGIQFAFNDSEARTEYKSGHPVIVNDSVTVAVLPAHGSSVSQFIFAIFRDGTAVFSSNTLMPLAGAGINIQAQTDTTPGLKPGTVQLYAWGVDGNGNYSTPTIVTFSINDTQDSTKTKL